MADDPAGRILVVEDDHDARRALAELLQHQGYDVIEAENGRVALERLRSANDVRLILLDLYMPEMDGRAFRAEQMKHADMAGIPVIIITGAFEMVRGTDPRGVVAVLSKPVEFDHLLPIIDQHC
ncbi:MAG: response regulator [Candidatus Binatia bacterium]